jgi:hypothetical protein
VADGLDQHVLEVDTAADGKPPFPLGVDRPVHLQEQHGVARLTAIGYLTSICTAS